jgi:SAM-dependent methyltransferase
MTTNDREKMRDFYDQLAEGEWTRLEATPSTRVAYEVHRRFLARFVRSGHRVLEAGAGPGRFTFELAKLGATVDVTDFSPVQLELHRQHLAGTDAEAAVASRTLLDICDTSRYGDASFDVVLAYGGPLSYAFEQTEDALEGLFRIVKPGGAVVASVMSLLGTWRHALRGVVEETKVSGEDANDLVLTTGDLRYIGRDHVCQMFRSREIPELVTRCGGELLAMSASNWASLEDRDILEELEADPDRWARFMKHEVAACAEPGALDGGTHLLFAARRP